MNPKTHTDSIGLYGGTFNPIHFGHINLAIELKEKAGLSKVWVIPAARSPLKSHEKEVDSVHRLRMAQLAFSQIPGFEVLDLEIKRGGPSYTFDTINEIVTTYKKKQFYLLLGEDSVFQLSLWKNVEEIVHLIPLLIGYRHGFNLDLQLEALNLTSSIVDAIQKGRVETSYFEISATRIRNRLKNKLFCGHLIPSKVLDYILENQLYFNSSCNEEPLQNSLF